MTKKSQLGNDNNGFSIKSIYPDIDVKDFTIDNVDYSETSKGFLIMHIRERGGENFLSEKYEAECFRKYLKKEVDKNDTMRSWLDHLLDVLIIVEPLGESLKENKIWSESKKRGVNMDMFISKTANYRKFLEREDIPKIPNVCDLMECGIPLSMSRRWTLSLNQFCKKKDVKNPLDENLIDVLKELERILELKKNQYKNKSNKGSVEERGIARSLEVYFKEMFRVEKRPMQLIIYFINIYFQKNYENDIVDEWFK